MRAQVHVRLYPLLTGVLRSIDSHHAQVGFFTSSTDGLIPFARLLATNKPFSRNSETDSPYADADRPNTAKWQRRHPAPTAVNIVTARY